MTLTELIQKILNSTSNDWNDIGCWGAFSGPSYKDKLEFYNVYDGEPNILHVDSHSNVLVFKPDISITMAYGLSSNDEFKAEWANQFPDPSASSSFIDIFYNNALVFRETYLTVDGGRCKLPIPSYGENHKDLVVSKEYYDFIRLLQKLSSGSNDEKNFNYYFGQTGIKIIDSEWIQ